MYKEIWEASCGQVFPCLREVGNAFDPFAVSVVRDSDIIGHVPRKISATCSLFLRNRGTVKCTVTGTRQFSRDLAQGGLEIPCQLTFEGEKKYIEKVQNLIKLSADTKASSTSSAPVTATATSSSSTQDVVVISDGISDNGKRRKVDDEIQDDVNDGGEMNDDLWLRIYNVALKSSEKSLLLGDDELNDKIINAAQKMLINQFPSLQGLRSTLVQYYLGFWKEKYLQIIHSRSSHWITVTTIGCQRGELKVYDSLYNSVDDATKQRIETTFATKVKFVMPRVQKQEGYKDCGLFSIAFATHLAFGKTDFKIQQGRMRQHLIECFEKQHISVFP